MIIPDIIQFNDICNIIAVIIVQKGQPQGIAPTAKTIGNMIGMFQSIVTVEYIRGVKKLGWQPFDGKFWQRNYYEHIIRNEKILLKHIGLKYQ